MTSVLPVIDASSQTGAESAKESAVRAWSDWMGMVAAIGCAIHCAAMPFVIAYLPSLGLSFLADEGFHKWMAIGCFAIAVSAFIPGFRKHGRWSPMMTGSVGLGLISFAAFGPIEGCCEEGACAVANVASEDVSACDDEHCQDCHGEHSTEATDLSKLDSSTDVTGAICEDACCVDPDAIAVASAGGANELPSWLGYVAPWLTPLGGFVLIAAHLLNRRQCSCCTRNASELAVST